MIERIPREVQVVFEFCLRSTKISAVILSFLLMAFTGLLDVSPAMAAGASTAPSVRQGCYYDLPQITANLRPVDGYSRFMSLHLSVCVPDDETANYLERIQPRLLDSIQPYLRDLRVEDLHGAEGMYRVRHGLLARMRAAASPMSIEQVVFREILVD